jgi:hypothetical protein
MSASRITAHIITLLLILAGILLLQKPLFGRTIPATPNPHLTSFQPSQKCTHTLIQSHGNF